MLFIFKWFHNADFLMQETNIKSNKTICRLRKLLREVCVETFINNVQKIVQIDETLVFRRKYNVGTLPRQYGLYVEFVQKIQLYF